MMKADDLRARLREWAGAARANPLFRRSLIAATLVALLDQATKAWIVYGLKLPQRPGGHVEISALFDLTYVRNYGASFGMLAGGIGSRILLSAISVGVSAFLIGWLARIGRPLAAAGVALIIGGAVGNLIDRVSLGYVVDFLDFSGFPFPLLRRAEGFPPFEIFNGGFIWVFNVADAAINVGIALLLVDWIREEGRARAAARVASAPTDRPSPDQPSL